MLQKSVFVILYIAVALSSAQKFTSEQVKCHGKWMVLNRLIKQKMKQIPTVVFENIVCKAVVQEIEEEVSKVDPSKKVDVSGFRLDASGNAISKTVPLSKSEMFLTEVMEKICDKMDDYLRATHKKTGKFMLLKIMVDGKMNPESSNVDFIQDEDLNKSLGHYVSTFIYLFIFFWEYINNKCYVSKQCLEILEDHEEAFLKNFQSPTLDENLDIKICSEQAKYCKDAPMQEDYDFDDKDELWFLFI